MATNAPAVCDVVTGLRPNVPRDNLAPDAIETRKGMGSNRNAALFGKFSTKNWNGMKKKAVNLRTEKCSVMRCMTEYYILWEYASASEKAAQPAWNGETFGLISR